LEGSKRWRIFSPTVVHPTEMMPPDAAPSEDLVFDEVLEPGDMLVMPAGYWHYCENGAGLSLHGVIAFDPPNALQALRVLVKDLAADERFRRPLSRFAEPAERAAHEAALKALLIERIGQLSMAQLQTRAPGDELSAIPGPAQK
jgi:ribosomal protein L16 Arg81 hydroxylase